MNRKLRIILTGVGIVIIAGLTCLLVNDINITSHYNKGNKSYNNHYYVGAISQYEKAASGWFLGKRDCDIHVNKGLALCRKYKIIGADKTEMTNDEIEDMIDDIEEIKAYLIENNCATADDKGHDSDAQQLYNDLCNFEEELEQQEEDNNNSENDQSSGGGGQSSDDNQNSGGGQNSDNNQDSNGDQNSDDNQDSNGDQNSDDNQDSNGDQNSDDNQDSNGDQDSDDDQDSGGSSSGSDSEDDELGDLYQQQQQESNNERNDELGQDDTSNGGQMGNRW